MNNNQLSIERLVNIISKSNYGAIVIPNQFNIDLVASACALYLSLLQKGVNITLTCETAVDFDLIGVDKFQKTLTAPGDNLVISFPYTDGAIDKIDYRIENDRFNLIIIPREKGKKLDSKEVNFYYTGSNFDFIIVLNAPTLNALGSLYQNNPDLFQGREIINIDKHFTNTNFGTLNIVRKNTSSFSEIIYTILKEGQFYIDKDIATNLYAGLASATNNFTSFSTNADTFQTAAELLRLGAIKKIIKKREVEVSSSSKSPFSFPKQTYSSSSLRQENQQTKPISEVEKDNKSEKPTPPEEWLKPKIFKGSGLI